MKKVEFEVLNVVPSGTGTGRYTVLLKERKGNRVLQILVEQVQAQAIVFPLLMQEQGNQEIPLTHDLMCHMLDGLNATLQEINIIGMVEGLFYAQLVLITTDGSELLLSSRTSDALALATRKKKSIFVYEVIVNEAGIVVQTENMEEEEEEEEPEELSLEATLKKMDLEELTQRLDAAIDEENYELAAKLRDEMNNREA